MPKKTAAAEAERPVDEEAEGMNSALQKRCEKVREALAKAGPADTHARYQLGKLVADAMANERKYGKKAVAQIATSFGQDAKTLYRYAQVAKVWSSADLKVLLMPSAVTGLPMSFSHLLELASVSDKRRRDKYMKQVLKEGLSVRDLKLRINPERAADGGEPEIDTARALRGLRSASGTWLTRVRTWEERLLPALDETPPSPELREHYEKTLEQHRELIARLQHVTEKLGSWLGDAPASRERPTLEEDALKDEDADEDADEEEAQEEAEAHDGTQAEEEDVEDEEAEEEDAEEETRARTA